MRETILKPVHQRKPTDCQGLQMMLHLYVDGELVGADKAELEAHLTTCPTCRATRDGLLSLKHSLRTLSGTEEMSPAAAARVRTAVKSARQKERTRGVLLAASLVAMLLLGVGTAFWLFDGARAPAHQQKLAAYAVQLHELDVPVDLATPDRARAERYLATRMGEPVPVPALETRGFGLRGARVVGVGEMPSAQLVYMGDLGQRLSVVVWPDKGGQLARRAGLSAAALAVGHDDDVTVLLHNDDAVVAATGDVDGATLHALFVPPGR